MFKYRCIRCGELWYSAADIKYLRIKSCEACGGELFQEDGCRCNNGKNINFQEGERNMNKGIIYPKKPVWDPLVSVVGNKTKEFMFMGQVPLGQIWVYLYKHRITRRYLNLDGRGQAYLFTTNGYVPIGIREAIDRVFS